MTETLSDKIKFVDFKEDIKEDTLYEHSIEVLEVKKVREAVKNLKDKLKSVTEPHGVNHIVQVTIKKVFGEKLI